ncbi:MAG: histidinol-phosphate transaminase [Zavarzinella sp.]
MSDIRENVLSMRGYTPGEQPRGQQILKLNTNENPYPPSPHVFTAIQEALTPDRLRKYPEPRGDTFRQAAAQVLNIDPNSILIGNGSDDLLTILTRVYVPEKGLMVSPTPSYILYRTLAEIQGARFVQVPFTSDWQLPDPWPVQQAHLTLVPNPNSPSGTMVSHASLRQIAELSPLVLDEAYADFADSNGLQLASKRIIVTRSFSKSYSLAGIRFGFAIADPSVIHECEKVKDSYNCDVMSLAAATAAIQDQDYMAQVRQKIRNTRTRLQPIMENLGFQVTESHANFLWCTRTDQPVEPIYQALKQRGILIRYMNYGEHGDGLRVTIGTDEQIDFFVQELTTILASCKIT